MFRRCERRYGLYNFHFTRLDVAIDDKNEKPFFTLEQIKKKCEKEEFIANSEAITLTKASLMILIPQRRVISVLESRDCSTVFMTKTRKFV